ncbi:heavy metal translocating P-type ATPase [Succinivibrio dextrinosolvens]|uniref:heavy metal translocating P-type ATPase n=1 Tax=Succinivibrio dextrinosolvens TaxID=83771 RepID=UPI00241CDAE5|nr:heavy metal translocating P-type ATPase [Succinivibrio dextrinosolvens]MBE6423738.1 cadmium-translocating P-type ATPase [Succinivibrio dextrinosolvens]
MLSFQEKHEKSLLGFALVVMLVLIYNKYFAQTPMPIVYQAVIAVAAYLLIASDVLVSAFKTLFKQRRMSEQFLMMIATFGAFGLCDLPEALAVMIFYKIGELFEEYASGRAHNDISSLVKLKPSFVRLVDENGNEQKVKPRQVKIGDVFKVLKGEVIAIDGNLCDESAAIDTSALTGESEPRLYTCGQSVPSGCINQGQVIHLRANTLSKNSSITRLLNLIEDAAASKSKPENLIRRFSVWYTPLVVGCAVLLALVPLFYSQAEFSDWIERALVFLVVSCPCALVLSVPLSFFGGMGAISRIGVIVKGSIHIETLSRLKAIAFDKTGTLTYGKFTVNNIHSVSISDDELLSYAVSLEKNSTHPIALSIVEYGKQRKVREFEVGSVIEKSGMGLESTINGHDVRIGRKEYISKYCGAFDYTEEDEESSYVYISLDNEFSGVIAIADTLKPSAGTMLDSLHSMGIKTVLISGDKRSVAEGISRKLGIKECYYEQTPQGKLDTLNSLKNKLSPVAFAGDGLNDAPVVSASDVGIAMGDIGSASAIEAADVVIMHGDLSAISRTVLLAKKTYKLAISNMYFVMLVKLLILLLGALGIANIWLAIFGDVGVLILAVCNAMRSLKFK